jgi:GT2 family glycosyltransferase
VIKYSIIIPSYNRIDLLSKCMISVKNTINLDTTEVIVACNGCKDGSPELVASMGFKYVYYPEPLGFARAVNMGYTASSGQYIVLLNNDTELLAPGWIDILESAFLADPRTGISGPSLGTRGGRPWAVMFCTMVKRELFDRLGLLDTAFGQGAGEDTDFGVRAFDLGYKIYQVPLNTPIVGPNGNNDVAFGHFPIWHPGGTTCKTLSAFKETLAHNEQLLRDRYGL